jgi:hypothetical protein
LFQFSAFHVISVALINFLLPEMAQAFNSWNITAAQVAGGKSAPYGMSELF